MAGSRKRKGEHGSAGLLAILISAAFGTAGFFSLTPALSHAETLAARIELQAAGQQLQISPPASTAQARATLTADDPGLPLAAGPVATRSGLVGISVGPNGWALAEVAGAHCVVVSGSATGISESETPISTEGRCVA